MGSDFKYPKERIAVRLERKDRETVARFGVNHLVPPHAAAGATPRNAAPAPRDSMLNLLVKREVDAISNWILGA